MAFTDTTGCSSVNANTNTNEPDDISVFLRQLINQSPKPCLSSFPAIGTHAGDQTLPCFSSPPVCIPGLDRVPDDTLNGVVFSTRTGYLQRSGGSNLSSESLSGPSARSDDCASESEEGLDDDEKKQGLPRNQSSKRSRAAEVHNLSEKRRRSRINEKMKALQNLIPNSNKTDKASMLDEAIEYLKQLQLQVQMLSMRNGLSLHPLCLPGASGIVHPAEISQLALDFSKRDDCLDAYVTNALTMNPASLPNASTIINVEPASFDLHSSSQGNFGPFLPRSSPQAVCREADIFRERLLVTTSETRSLEKVESRATAILQPSSSKEHQPLEACTSAQKYGLQEMFQEQSSAQNRLNLSDISGLHAVTTSAQDEKLTRDRRR